MKTLKESFNLLQEYLDDVEELINPLSYRDELKALMDPETRKEMCEKHPHCFLPVNIGNKDAFIMPVCNRKGAYDKNMIAFSKKFANRMLGNPEVNRGMLEISIRKMEDLEKDPNQEHSDRIKNYLNKL